MGRLRIYHFKKGDKMIDRTATICPHCGRISFGWGYKCAYCMKDARIDKVEAYDKIRDYDSSVRDANRGGEEDENI